MPKLAEVAPELEFVAFVNKEAAPVAREIVGDRVQICKLDVAGRSRVRRVLAEQTTLPRAARRRQIDILHSFASTSPAFMKPISVLTLLDVTYALEPSAHTRAMRAGMSVLVPLAAKRAKRIIAISNSAADEIAQELKLPRERIDVVHLGRREPAEPVAEDELRRKHGLWRLADRAERVGAAPPQEPQQAAAGIRRRRGGSRAGAGVARLPDARG